MSLDFEKAKHIFLEAVERSDSHERNAFLDEACGGDEDLHRHIALLLDAHKQSGTFLDKGAVAVVATLDQPITEKPGTVIGRYKLKEQIGEGGMGVVYVAEQTEPVRRKVALKIIKPGMDTRQVIARFEAERQALALMDHPNIARVLDAGATESGRPFFVMELVRGMPITDYCDQAKLTTTERLKLFSKVCQAVQHAHQKGIIHRDIKPSNVMVTLHDGVPIPKVIDFGVAKAINQRLTEQSVYTQLTEMIGTPLYMSPEQAELSALDVDTRSDVYSLGVLLYELLTGTTPFDKATLREAGFDEIRRIIREKEPPKPSDRLSTVEAESRSTISEQRGIDPRKLTHTLRGDLDWIVMKALEKDRTRRYETANEFAADVRRYLDDKPVEACPPSTAYRLRTFARRNKTALVVGAVVALALVVGAGVAAWQSVRATLALGREREARETIEKQHTEVKHQRDEVLDREAALRRYVYAAAVHWAWQAWNNADLGQVRDLLSGYIPPPGQPDLRCFAWHYLWALCQTRSKILSGHTDEVFHLAFSPDGKVLASGGRDRTVILWDPVTGKKLSTLEGHTDDVNSIAFSADGKLLVTAGEERVVKIWDVARGELRRTITGFEFPVARVLLTPDDKTLVVAEVHWLTGKAKTTLWDPSTGERQGALGGVRALALSRDGRTLATSTWTGKLQLWDVATRQATQEVQTDSRGLADEMLAGAFSPDGQILAIGSRNSRIKLWTVAPLDEVAALHGHSGSVRSVAFSPDGRRLASVADDAQLRLWDPQSHSPWGVLTGHTYRVWSVAFAPDGKTVATACGDRTIRLWDLNQTGGRIALALPSGAGCIPSIALLPNGKTVVTPGDAWHAKFWNLKTGELEGPVSGDFVTAVAVSPVKRLLAIGTNAGYIHLRDLATGNEKMTISAHPTGAVTSLAFSPDGRLLVSSVIRPPPIRLFPTMTAGRP